MWVDGTEDLRKFVAGVERTRAKLAVFHDVWDLVAIDPGDSSASLDNQGRRIKGGSVRDRKASGNAGASWQSSLAFIESFRELPKTLLADLEQRLATLSICRGEVLVRQGDEADALYLVASGRFAVDVDGHRISEVGSGAPIGEVAFFAHGKRTATVTALRDSIVLQLPRADFVALAEDQPAVLKPVAVTLARRLADITLAGGERPLLSCPRTIVVMGAGGAPVPDTFREKLARALSSMANILVIDAVTLAELFPGESNFESHAITSWLNQQEACYDYILYFADGELTPFSRTAIRQADQVILVGLHQAHIGSELSTLESFDFEIHPTSTRRLVLLHDARTPISGTSRWLDLRPMALHHHLVVDEDVDYNRLARFINGKAIGFVACGGGALCAAHIGVFKAFREAGIGFDMFGGTSGGGAIAAAFAMGASPEDVSMRTTDIFLNARALKRLTWPRYSLFDHTVFDRALKAHYGETEIEDLWTGYFAVATCLASNALFLLTRGPVWQAVRATSSIPGLLPPVYREDGRMLVDGSLLDNLPLKSIAPATRA
jgi:NTE family protein